MLSIPQLKQIEGQNPYLYEALRRIVGAVNSLGQRLKIDPAPAAQSVAGKTLAPPGPPASLTVTAARGIFSVTLAAPAGSTTPIDYSVEAASDTGFSSVTVYPLGGSLAANISLGNVTRYWRARAKYIESDYGPYVYLGTPANPTGVAGGLANSNDIIYNPPSNTANFATVDSIDAGSSATIRIYGAGGVGSSWTQNYGQGTRTFPAGTITGKAYSTAYYVMYDTVGQAYLAFTSFASTVNDNYVLAGKMTTVASGGGGGSSGGGGGGGGAAGCCEVGTPLAFPAASSVALTLEPCDEWVELELLGGKRVVVAPRTLVSTFVLACDLEPGALVETEGGEFEILRAALKLHKVSHKLVARVLPQHTYWGNGIRMHNMKPLQ